MLEICRKTGKNIKNIQIFSFHEKYVKVYSHNWNLMIRKDIWYLENCPSFNLPLFLFQNN